MPDSELSTDDRPWRAEDVLADAISQREAHHADRPSTRDALREALAKQAPPVLRVDDEALGAEQLEKPSTVIAPPRKANSPDKELPKEPPIDVPNLELLTCLGAGGFGQVWLARNTKLEHECACKLIPESRAVELEGLQRIKRVPSHAHLLPIEWVDVVDGWVCCVMPLAETVETDKGPTALSLYTYLERRGPLPSKEVARIGADLADALQWLHEHGVTHGDVKPDNVLQLSGAWMLADYGLVRDLAFPTGERHTPDRWPPEGPGKPPADQYLLSVVLFELLTGWSTDRLAEFRTRRLERAGLDRGAPKLAEIIIRATTERPENRFGSVRELRDALESTLAPRRTRRWILTGGAIAAVLGVVAITAVVLGPDPLAELRVESFDVQHYRYDEGDDLDLILGSLLSHETPAAQVNDNMTIHAKLSAPAYAYLLALNTAGQVELCLPPSKSDAPRATETLVFPVDPSFRYWLTDGPGFHGFMLIASAEPLSAWSEWVKANGEPKWMAQAPESETAWIYDGHQLVPAGGTRGTLGPRRGSPRPVLSAVEWVKAQPEVDAAYLIAFPVLPLAQEP